MTILTPRELHLFPLDAMMRLSQAAGWNQTPADWQRLITLSPGLCWGIEMDGRLAATATAITYDDDLAWIGMVLTLPEHRGKGLARKLVSTILDLLKARNIPSIGLDATTMGAPLYRSFGFEDQCPIERWSRSGTQLPFHLPTPIQTTNVIEALAAESTVHSREDAYLLLRPGHLANYVGPFVAEDESDAEELLTQIPREASLYWDLFPQNPIATRLATEQGLSSTRQLIRMSLGQALPPPAHTCLAIAGFEYG